MLDHISQLHTADRRPVGAFPAGGQFIGYADIANFVRCHLRVLAVAPAAALVAALIYVLVTDPVFTAKSQLLIEPAMPQLLREQSGEVNFSLDNAQVESDMAVLRSEKIAMMVINGLDLIHDPEFQNEGQSVFGMPRSLFAEQNESRATEPGNAGVAAEFVRSRRTIAKFESGLDVRRTGLSYAVEVAFSSKDPDKAARLANATAEAYIREQVETKSEKARVGSEWLEQRLAQLRAQLNTATQMAQEFRAKHDYRIRSKTDNGIEAGRQAADGLLASAGENYTLEELETTAETYRKMYESYLQGFTAAVQRQSYPVAEARIITLASRPLAKSHPRTPLVLALGGLIGLTAGLGIAIVRHNLDRSLRSPQQIRDELGLECLGSLPPIVAAMTPLNQVAAAPLSPFSGSLKRVKAVINLASRNQSIRCLGITSALSGEGKSTVVGNLATLFSMSGMRTLVVDADFLNPTLTEAFAPDAAAGLIDAVQEGKNIEEHIVCATNGSFDLLPAIRDFNDVLGLEPMQVMLKDVFRTYDIIVFDIPPANPCVDWLAFSPLLDAVAVVAEWGRTPVDLVSEMLHPLWMAKIPVLGVIMTKVDDGFIADRHTLAGTYYPWSKQPI